METLINCPVCDSIQLSPFLICKDNTVTGEKFQIVECLSCGFKFTNPRPEEKNSALYYKSENYVSHSNSKKGVINTLYQVIRKYTLLKKLQMISSYFKTGKILDIGCGTGEFLNIFKKARWNTLGIEPDFDARKMATNNYALDVREEKELKNLKESSFEVITLWHVLEHVYLLNERIEDIKRLLKPNGIIVIAVPNCNSLDARVYKEKWAAYDVPRHLYHFTPKNIEDIFDKHKLKVIRMLPMVFDSFYISMLSEKIKTGKVNIFRSTWNGIRSNFLALKKEGVYSSQIYIIQKKQFCELHS